LGSRVWTQNISDLLGKNVRRRACGGGLERRNLDSRGEKNGGDLREKNGGEPGVENWIPPNFDGFSYLHFGLPSFFCLK
jgi:hypothetical protein